jgi:hypothetical protein
VPAITAARIVGDHSTRCAVAFRRSCVVTRFWIWGGELHPLAAVTMMQLPRVFSPTVIQHPVALFPLGAWYPCIVLCGSLLMSGGMAHAQLRRNPDIKPNDYIQLECAPVRISPREKDTDAVFKINVNLEFNDFADLESFHVGHTTINGNFYVRSDQYNQTALDQPVPFKSRWSWRGVWKKNANVAMVGDVTRNVNGTWSYTETLFQYGRVGMVMESRCHTVERD